jgi:hypothetical protein
MARLLVGEAIECSLDCAAVLLHERVELGALITQKHIERAHHILSITTPTQRRQVREALQSDVSDRRTWVSVRPAVEVADVRLADVKLSGRAVLVTDPGECDAFRAWLSSERGVEPADDAIDGGTEQWTLRSPLPRRLQTSVDWPGCEANSQRP